MHEEECSEQVQSPGAHSGEGVGETTIQQASQGKVEVAGEGEADLSVHLAQWPLHAVSCALHHLLKTLGGEGREGGGD